MVVFFGCQLFISIMHKGFSGFSKSESQSHESFMDLILNSMDLESHGSQPIENGFISEPDKEFLKIQEHSRVSSEPISSLGDDSLFSGVQNDRGNIIFHSFPEVNIVNSSSSSEIETLEQPWVFNELGEFSIDHLEGTFGSIEHSENNGSWGIIKSGVFLHNFSEFRVRVRFSELSEFFRSQGEGRSLGFLDKVDEIISFIGGSS